MSFDTREHPTAPAPSAESGRGARRAVAIVVTVAVCIGGLAAVTWATRSTDQATTAIDGEFSRVVVDVSAGEVEIVGGAEGEATLESHTVHSWFRDAEVTHEIEGDTLRVEGTCGSGLSLFTWCSTDVTLTIPAGVDVVADSSAGQVSARGLDGSADLSSSAGTVRVEDHRGDLVAHSSAGAVVVDGLRAETAKITSSAGRVEVHVAEAPASLDVESSAGSVEVTLPDGQTYDVDADTSAGKTSVEVPTDPSSQHEVRAFSSAGSVSVTTD